MRAGRALPRTIRAATRCPSAAWAARDIAHGDRPADGGAEAAGGDWRPAPCRRRRRISVTARAGAWPSGRRPTTFARRPALQLAQDQRRHRGNRPVAPAFADRPSRARPRPEMVVDRCRGRTGRARPPGAASCARRGRPARPPAHPAGVGRQRRGAIGRDRRSRSRPRRCSRSARPGSPLRPRDRRESMNRSRPRPARARAITVGGRRALAGRATRGPRASTTPAGRLRAMWARSASSARRSRRRTVLAAALADASGRRACRPPSSVSSV